MTVLVNAPRAVRGPLTIDIPERAVPVGTTKVKIEIQPFAWPNPGVEVGSLFFEFSFDNGATWYVGFLMPLTGGQRPYKGNPDPPCGIEWRLIQVADTNTRVRGHIVLLAALDCSATLEAA